MRRYRQHLLGAFGSILGVTSLAACSDLRDDFSESVCQGGTVSLVRQLQPAEPVEYVALLRAGFESTPDVVQEQGSCPASANCSDLQAIPTQEGMRQGGFDGSTVHLGYVRNDSVGLLFTLGEVRTFLGTIDTPSEAALLAFLSGFDLDCEGPNVEQIDGGFLIYAETGTTCGDDITGHVLLVGEDGSISEQDSKIVEHGDDGCVIGRLPAGLARGACAKPEGVGAFFAEVSRLEAASVAAFEDLATELAHHGAPAELSAWASRAAREETRHALMTGALARRYGADRKIPRVQRQAPRALEAIARDNAIEGLGRETYGALIGHHQALHASDPAIRTVMQQIARDETRHAELSHALDAWLSTQLSRGARKRVAQARRAALTTFRSSLCREPHPEVQRLAGVPSAAHAQRMFDQLFASEGIAA